MGRRLNLRKEYLAELGADELAAMAGAMQEPTTDTAASCGIVACTYTRNVECLAEKLTLRCYSVGAGPPPPA